MFNNKGRSYKHYNYKEGRNKDSKSSKKASRELYKNHKGKINI